MLQIEPSATKKTYRPLFKEPHEEVLIKVAEGLLIYGTEIKSYTPKELEAKFGII
jgi:hypothetical protein